jgi:hypothetical protein
MPNEVIMDHPAQYGGGARALPLFYFSPMSFSPM